MDKFLPSVSNEKMYKLYNRHKLSINIHASVVRSGTNMRTFECAACGIPQLVEYRPGIDKYFDIEKEIIVFYSLEDLFEKIHIINDDKKLFNLRTNSIQRAYLDHTYYNRVKRYWMNIYKYNTSLIEVIFLTIAVVSICLPLHGNGLYLLPAIYILYLRREEILIDREIKKIFAYFFLYLIVFTLISEDFRISIKGIYDI